MSTKTNFKRVALVAVASLGLGVLTSVAPANAAAADGVTTIDSGSFCNATDDAGATITAPFVSTDSPTTGVNLVAPVGGNALLLIEEDDAVQLTGSVIAVSGLDAADAVVKLSPTGKVVIDDIGNGDESVLVAFTGVGTVTFVTVADGDETSSFADANGDNTITVTVVASCSNGAFSVSKSGIRVTESAEDTTPLYTEGDDLQAEAGNDLYISIDADNSYNQALPSGTWTTSATNGATVAIGSSAPAAAGDFPFAFDTLGGNNVYVRVTPKDAAVASSTTVTVSYNGALITSKSLTFLGEATKITIIANTVGKKDGSSGMAWYTLQDAAGNNVPGALSVDSTTVGTRVYNVTSIASANQDGATAGSNVIGGLFDVAALGSIKYGILKFECANGQGAGTGTATVRHLQAVTGAYITLPMTFTCAGGMDTYAISMDKASYKVGEIATLTITAKDSKGNPVHDFQLVAGTANNISVGGGSLVKADTGTDTFGILAGSATGVKTYKIQLTTAGAFNTVVNLAGSTTTSVTAAYTVSSGGTSLEDVLKAIVSLIASINKQIAALQKALLKKK